jgi:hypothetical protein
MAAFAGALVMGKLKNELTDRQLGAWCITATDQDSDTHVPFSLKSALLLNSH